MGIYEITFDHPYHGEMTLSEYSLSALFAVAMDYDHKCKDISGCDVANMSAGAFHLIAAHRAMSATECYTLSEVADKYAAEFTREAIDAEENAWWDTVKKAARYCPHCNSLAYSPSRDKTPPCHCPDCGKDFDPKKAERTTRK